VRIHFHLKNSQHVIPDNLGIEVSRPDEALAQARLVIQEFQQDGARDYSGWTLVAADSAGKVLFTLELHSAG
jgi:hypothetical protein